MKPGGILIAPSVIAADFSYLRAEIARVEQGGADMIHVDIMDGHFVPNITFGPAMVKTIRSLTKLPLDVHLMLSKPRQFITAFAKAGASNITIHIECEDTIRTAMEEIDVFDCTVGLSVRPKTPVAALKDYLGRIQRLLVMTVEPGFGGQKFMPEMLEKVKEAVELREKGGYKYDIEVDGGLDKYTIWPSVRAGAEVIVAGTAVFGQADAEQAIHDIREGARQAMAHLTEPPEPTEPPAS
jgi:ribulose-phosphate 3-epimerase